jgi:hypothetical protein
MLSLPSTNEHIGFFIKTITRNGKDIQVLAILFEPILSNFAAIADNGDTLHSQFLFQREEKSYQLKGKGKQNSF